MSSLRRNTLMLLAAAIGVPSARGDDDRYRFAPGAGEERAVSLTASTDGVRFAWVQPATAGWDTALLGVRVSATEPEPWVEIAAGAGRSRLFLDPGAQGLRWLNLTGLKEQLAEGAAVEVQTSGVAIECGAATLRVFANRLDLRRRILVIAPHPDDAEIAAFGLYAGRNATIVTVTSGNAGDANYQDQFQDVAEQYKFKGFLRAVDSVTVPWQGGIPPERCFNLGYFDARLRNMYEQPEAVVAEVYGPNTDISVYRRANVGRLLETGPRASTWKNLVNDMRAVLRKVKPAIVVMAHPSLDNHADHQFASVALVEALDALKGQVTFLLYTNHAVQNLYPFGPAGTGMSLPPWSGPELAVEGVYSHPVSADLQRRKLFALESMHDLRPSPSEQHACPPVGGPPPRPDYPRQPAVDYFRRGPRAEEVFFVFGRDGVRAAIRSFLAENGARAVAEPKK